MKKFWSDKQRLLKHILKRLLFIFIGTFLMSITINALYLPYNILSGGITGIALLFNLLFNIN